MTLAPNAIRAETAELIKHLDRVEGTLAHGLDQLNATITLLREPIDFLQSALDAYRKRYLKQALHVNKTLTKWYARLANDPDLRFPHRKIMEYLLTLHNGVTDTFEEAHFSKIVRHCKLGKNMAKGYLTLLERKRYIECRNDGYRVHYRVRGL